MAYRRRQLQNSALRQKAILIDQVTYPAAVQVFHDQEQRTVLSLESINGNDIGVIQAGREFGLLNEALLCPGLREDIRVQLLDSDEPLQRGVLCLVDHTESPLAKHVKDAKLVERIARLKEHGALRLQGQE